MVDIWEPHTPQIRIAALARGLLVLLLLYWGCFAAVVPVTVWDSQAYNVARLPLALLGGLFGNPYWNDSRQAAFPWGFDAIHLPFYLSDGGFAIPSFFCFLGTLCIVYVIVRAHYGSDIATLCVLSLFAAPTFLSQATSTKNDWGVMFGVAVLVLLSLVALKIAAKMASLGHGLLVRFYTRRKINRDTINGFGECDHTLRPSEKPS